MKKTIDELLETLPVPGMGAAVDHQGIIQIIGQIGHFFGGEAEIPQPADIHDHMAVHALRVLHHEQVAYPQGGA
jgi:hypothetical protein